MYVCMCVYVCSVHYSTLPRPMPEKYGSLESHGVISTLYTKLMGSSQILLYYSIKDSGCEHVIFILLVKSADYCEQKVCSGDGLVVYVLLKRQGLLSLSSACLMVSNCLSTISSSETCGVSIATVASMYDICYNIIIINRTENNSNYRPGSVLILEMQKTKS